MAWRSTSAIAAEGSCWSTDRRSRVSSVVGSARRPAAATAFAVAAGSFRQDQATRAAQTRNIGFRFSLLSLGQGFGSVGSFRFVVDSDRGSGSYNLDFAWWPFGGGVPLWRILAGDAVGGVPGTVFRPPHVWFEGVAEVGIWEGISDWRILKLPQPRPVSFMEALDPRE